MRALLSALLACLAVVCSAAEPPPALTRADVRPTACGAGGIGEVYAGPRAGTIEQREGKPGYRVNGDGFWAVGCTPELTPGTACGAPGVGIGAQGQTLAWTKPGKRVDDKGRWVDCERSCVPPSGATSAFRTWKAGEHSCTTFDRYATSPTDPARDQVLRHGSYGTWKQWMGPMRGSLIERCLDGERTVVAATCAPAMHCDSAIRFDRALYEGGRQVRRTYIYDARPQAARVPLGATVDAVATDGARWPVTCKAGDLVAPQELPRPVAPAASRPAPVVLPGCGPQTVRRNGLTAVYSGPRVQEGGAVTVRLGLRYTPAWCRDGLLSLDPPTVMPESAASSADAWRPK